MEKLITFTNPVLHDNVADPTIWNAHDGNYYMFHSGLFTDTIYQSTNWINWKNTNICPFNKETIDMLNDIAKKYNSDKCIYAPTVYEHNGEYLMYISISWKCMCVLHSKNPLGPFIFENNKSYILIDNEITGLDITNEDSSVAYDEENNKMYLVWGSHGNITRTTLTNDGLHLAPNAKFEHVAGAPKTAPRKIYEGAYLHKHGKYWYLFAARGNYTKAKGTYEVVVGRSKTLNGTFRNKYGLPMKWGFSTLILSPDSTEVYFGGGHTGEIYTDKNGNDYIFYQRQRADIIHYRPLFLQRIYWDKFGWPYFKNNVTQMEEVVPNI